MAKTMERRTEHLVVTGLVVAFACLYAAEGLLRHWHFASSLDLAIYDQFVWKLSRFETPASSVRGYANLFGDHFHPVFLLFVPLYWIVPSAKTLLVAQAVWLALSIVPVYAFAKSRLPVGTALALTVAYGFFWGLQRTASFDVHEMAFAPLFIAMAILFMDRRQWPWFWFSVVMVAAVKEDVIPVAIFLGLYLAVRGDRVRGLALAVAGGVAFCFVVGVLIPWFAGSAQFGYTSAYGEALAKPWTIPAMLVTPTVKLETLLMCLAPFAFTPLASPLIGLLVPLLLIRFLSASPNHWGTNFHYGAPLAPILAMAAADGLARWRNRVTSERTRRRLTLGVAWVSVIVAMIAPGHQEQWRLTKPATYRFTQSETGERAIALVPAGASVVAQTAILPHLSERDLAYSLTPDAPDADFVVAAVDIDPWPLAGRADIERLLDERRSHGYTTVFAQAGWVVLKR